MGDCWSAWSTYIIYLRCDFIIICQCAYLSAIFHFHFNICYCFLYWITTDVQLKYWRKLKLTFYMRLLNGSVWKNWIYVVNVWKVLLTSARISLGIIKLCSCVNEQIISVVHFLVCSTLTQILACACS